ncbi:MAG: hypothetical protein SGJ23_05185 [Alphaproteobacteria bacterium]|nr:hypothetical protein [Alphaproteobacteria bacterium]
MSKRLVAVVAVAFLSGLSLAAAHAQAGMKTYTDPQSRFTIQHPSSWPVDPLPGSNETNQGVAIGIADAECKVVALKSDQSLGKPVEAVRRAYATTIGEASWKSKADGYNVWSRRGTVTAVAVDSSKFWPIQTASFTTDDGKPGFAQMHPRPGVEVWMFCSSFDDRDRKATFDQIFASFAGTNDAALQAQAEAAAAAQPVAPPPAEQKKKR